MEKDNIVNKINDIRDHHLNGILNTTLQESLKNQLINTKNINECVEILKKENDPLIENINQYKFIDVVKKLESYNTFLKQQSLDGKIEWCPKEDYDYIKGKIFEGIIAYCGKKLGMYSEESIKFRDAGLTVHDDDNFFGFIEKYAEKEAKNKLSNN